MTVMRKRGGTIRHGNLQRTGTVYGEYLMSGEQREYWPHLLSLRHQEVKKIADSPKVSCRGNNMSPQPTARLLLRKGMGKYHSKQRLRI